MDKSFDWIKSAISSSTSPFHFDCCEILMELFAKKYQPECQEKYQILIADLIEKKTHYSPDA